MTTDAWAGAMAPVEFIDEPRVTREAYPERTPGCDPRVPYGLLADAKAKARALYPDAGRIVALWTPNSRTCEIHLEVWDPANRRARVLAANAL